MNRKWLAWAIIYAVSLFSAAPSVFGASLSGGSTLDDPASPSTGFSFPGFSQLKVCLGPTCSVIEGILQVTGVLPQTTLRCEGEACDCGSGDPPGAVTLTLSGKVNAELVGNNGNDIANTESCWEFGNSSGDTSDGLKIYAKAAFDDSKGACVYSAYAVDDGTSNPPENVQGSLVRKVSGGEDACGTSAEIKGCPVFSNNPSKAVLDCATALRIGVPVLNEQQLTKIFPPDSTTEPALDTLQVAAVEVPEDETVGGNATDIDARQRPCVSNPLTTDLTTEGSDVVVPGRSSIDCGNPNSGNPDKRREVAGAARIPTPSAGEWQINHIRKAGTNTTKYCVLDDPPKFLAMNIDLDSLTLNGFPRADGSSCNYSQADGANGPDACCFWVEGQVALDCTEGDPVILIAQGTVSNGSYDFIATTSPSPLCNVGGSQ